MALNFPNSPTLNQVYTDNTSGFSYQWNGTVWISFSAASSSQIKTLDDISASFNNSTQTFALTSGSVSITPPTSQSLIINLGGVIQDATDDYSVSGSNIVFSTAPTNGLSFSGVSLGPAIPVNTIPDGTVTDGSLTVAGILSTSNLFVTGVSTFIGLTTHTGTIFGNNLSLTGIATATEFDISGSSNTLTAGGLNVGVATASSVIVGSAVTINSSGINVTGITTIKNASGTVTIGIGTTALLVEGNARVTGILTVGSSSITLNGITDIINVGTGVTINGTTGTISATSFSGDGSGLTGVGVGTADNINTTGIITATSFSGDGSGLIGVGIGTDGSVNTTGNISAGIATFTRLDVPPIPITFSPADGATDVAVASNIVITFNGTVAKGTGNITLRENSAGGTAFSTIGVSSSSVSISGGAVTIDPPSNIGFAVTTFVVVDAGAFSGLTTTSVNALINTYSFTTAEVALGDSYEGGFLICKASPLRWVVSPRSAEVSRTWHLRNDANTTAQSVSGCTGWFVPTCGQLQNPGYCCRTFWGPSPCYSAINYWSSTEVNATHARYVTFGTGNVHNASKANTRCVRAFRCVTY
jgi:hypothetical protein